MSVISFTYINNICTLSTNINFICTIFRNRTERNILRPCLSVSRRVLINSIFANVYSYCAYTPMSCIHNVFNLNLRIKGKNFWNFAWISIWVSTTSSLFEQCILLLRSTSDAGIQRLYTSSKGILLLYLVNNCTYCSITACPCRLFSHESQVLRVYMKVHGVHFLTITNTCKFMWFPLGQRHPLLYSSINQTL